MARRIVNFNFNGEMPTDLSWCKTSYSTAEVECKYCTTPAARLTSYNIDTYLAEAIANMIGQTNSYHIAVGRTSSNSWVCEYRKHPSDPYTLVRVEVGFDDVWSVKAGIYDPARGTMSPYDPTSKKGTAIIAALLPTIVLDDEAGDAYETLKDLVGNIKDRVDEVTFGRAMCTLINNIYYRIKDDKSTNPVCVKQEVMRLSISDLEEINDGGAMKAMVSIQDFDVFRQVEDIFSTAPATKSEEEDEEEEKPKRRARKKTTSAAVSIKDMYKYDPERELTAEEEARVPELGDYYVVPEWATSTARRVTASKAFGKSAVKNILLYGPSGTGKTEGSKAIASMLGLPYYTLSCSTDDDKFDLIGQLVPNTDEATTESIGVTFEDIEENFVAAFTTLFGRAPGKLDTPADAYKELATRMSAKKNDFKFVHSELIDAIKYGGVVEIQEANVIKRQSVMEVLNPLLAGGEKAFIKLQNGEIITRHPDCIVIMTINREYEGTNDLQEAVYSRVNLIKQIEQPTVAELAERTMAQLKDSYKSNTATVNKMAKVTDMIHRYCVDKDITGGVTGPRELLDWAMYARIIADEKGEEKVSEASVIEAAKETILAKAAQNADDIEDITVGVFFKEYGISKF